MHNRTKQLGSLLNLCISTEEEIRWHNFYKHWIPKCSLAERNQIKSIEHSTHKLFLGIGMEHNTRNHSTVTFKVMSAVTTIHVPH